MVAESFRGYDLLTLGSACLHSRLCIVDGLASTTHWAALSKPGNPTMSGQDSYATSNYADYRRRFDLCRKYVSRNPGLVNYGLRVEVQDDDYVSLTDPVSGSPMQVQRPYYEAFVAHGDVLLPVRDVGKFVIVVKDDRVRTVAAVVVARPSDTGGRLARLPRLDDED